MAEEKEEVDIVFKILEDRYRMRGKRRCRRCGTTRGLIRKYGLYICRRCFREIGKDIGVHKYH